LDRILERKHGQPLELTRFLRIAIGLATALGHAHRSAFYMRKVEGQLYLSEEVAAEQNDA
jgi:hypothetical protein